MTLWLVMGAITIAATVQLATGFGFALVSVPLLALVTDAHIAVLLALLIGSLGNGYQAWEGRGHLERRVVARILAGAVLGLPLGWWIYAHTNARSLKLLIGVTILATVIFLIRGPGLRRSSQLIDLTVGALAGILTTSTGTNGPPLVSLLHARQVSPEVFRVTATTVFFALDALAVAFFAATGHLSVDLLRTALATLPGLLLGAWAGFKVRSLLSPERFRVVVLCLLALTGGMAIATAW